MTEAEWQAATDPKPMLSFLARKASDRKLRLFSVACCRRIWPFVSDPGSRDVVDLTEAAADGAIDPQRVLALDYYRLTGDHGDKIEPYRTASKVAGTVGCTFIAPLFDDDTFPGCEFTYALGTARAAAYVVAESQHEPDEPAGPFDLQSLLAANRKRMERADDFLKAGMAEQSSQASLLRCVVGNPFRLVALDPSWLTSTVVQLAAGIYEERAFDRLPILADALQDAGCEEEQVLAHCRGDGPHVRGCWVVDLLTGRV
jgi:hypothetical protein